MFQFLRYCCISNKMHYQEIICLQFARKYIFDCKRKKSRTYKRSSTSKEPHIGHYSLLIRVSRRKPTLVAVCMVNAITKELAFPFQTFKLLLNLLYVPYEHTVILPSYTLNQDSYHHDS